MKLQQFVTVTVAAALVVQLNACTLLSPEMQEQVGGILGGIGGGVLADKVSEHAPAAVRPLVTAAGVLIGAELGKRLSKYLNEQDQKKLQQQVSVQVQNPQPQTTVVCTNDQNPYLSVSERAAKSKNCGNEKKVVVSTGKITNIGGQKCRTLKTEVADTTKPLDTIDDQICEGPDGEWRAKTS